ncbi:MAG TPA: rhomboid family intramembrane serine protease [Actinomycetota bacterium]
MIPIRDHNPTSRPAIIVPLLIGINALVYFFWQPSFGSVNEQTVFAICHAAIPYEITEGELVLDGVRGGNLRSTDRAGAMQLRDVATVEGALCPDKNVWTSIIVSMFMHGGPAHIFFNMLFLWVFGNNIEDRLGRGRFVVFYLLAGIAAVYAHALVSSTSAIPLLGASGAIAGVLGAYLLLFPHARVTTLVFFFFITWIELPAVVVLGLWFLLQVFQQFGSVSGDVGAVAYLAHIGGFVAGMVLLLILRPRRAPPRAEYL